MTETSNAQHGLTEHSHGAGVPLQIRSDRPRSKSVSDFPAIDQWQDLWRYLDASALKGLDADVLGEYKDEVQFVETSGVTFSWIDSTDARVGTIGLPEDRVAAAAYTNASKTLLVEIAKDAIISEPIRINVVGSSSSASALHIVIVAGKFSQATLVLTHSGLGVLGENIELDVQDEAKLNFVSVQTWDCLLYTSDAADD